MNLFQLVFKQMRQRSLSSTLTIISVLLGVALSIAILVLQRESGKLFGQTDFGYDIIIGPPKSPRLQLVVNTVYHMYESAGTLPYTYFETLQRKVRGIKWKVPYAVGDNYHGKRIVGTLPDTFLPSVEDIRTPMEELINDLSDTTAVSSHTGQQVAKSLRAFAPRLRQIAQERTGYDDVAPQIAAAADRLEKTAAALPATDQPLKLDTAQPALEALDNTSSTLREISVLGPLEYRPDKTFQLAQGRVFYPRRFEAVIGSDIQEQTGLKLGDKFKAEHGLTDKPLDKDEHDEQWTVVGVLQKTHTANDHVIFIPLISLYAIPEHEKGMQELSGAPSPPTHATGEHHHEEAYDLDANGDIHLKLPKDKWRVSAILVRSSGVWGMNIMWNINLKGSDALAVRPADEMRSFFENFLKGSSWVLLLVSLLVTIVAAISILVSIYNSVSARTREIAILRALGATRVRVVTLICVEAGIIGLVGGLIGVFLGHLLTGVGSVYLEKQLGEGINYLAIGWIEWVYLGAVIILAILAGFVPAMKAYRTPVAANLVAA